MWIEWLTFCFTMINTVLLGYLWLCITEVQSDIWLQGATIRALWEHLTVDLSGARSRSKETKRAKS